MSKKFWIPILSAILIAAIGAAWWPANAQAQGGGLRDRLRRQRSVVGQVTAVSADSLSLLTARGDEVTFTVDERTRVRSRAGGDVSLDDVQVDDWVGVVPVKARLLGGSGEQPIARAIVLLPDDFDPANAKGGRGKVTTIDLAGNRFTIENPAGETLTVLVDDDTVYKGQVSALTDLQVGMTAGVIAEKQANGELMANTVRAGYPRVRRVGAVTAVDGASGQFTLERRHDGVEITVTVDSKTRFRSKDGAVDALKDLQPGMTVAVQGQEQADGTILAGVVLALPQR
jgi:hypothetical protein